MHPKRLLTASLRTLNLMDMRLRDMEHFIVVAEELNFRRAAERLYISQPALSRTIANLERELQVQLFARDRQTVRLTLAGEYLLQQAPTLLSQIDSLYQQLSLLDRTAHKTLVVGAQTGIGRGLMQRLAQALDKIEWRIQLRHIPWTDPTAGVLSRQCDAGFAWLGTTIDPQCNHIVVAEEPVLIAVREDHELAQRSSCVFSEIATETLIALPLEAGSLRDFWLAQYLRNGEPVPIGGIATSADEALENVISGNGSVLVSQGNAELYARTGIRFIPVSGLLPARFAFLWHRDNINPAINIVVQELT